MLVLLRWLIWFLRLVLSCLLYGVLDHFCIIREAYSMYVDLTSVSYAASALFVHSSLLVLLFSYCLIIFLQNDNNWKKSRTYNIMTLYLQPLLLWTGATLICRSLRYSFLYVKNWTDLFSRTFKDIFLTHLVWYSWSCFCRALDPVVLPTESSQVVKQRVLNFVRSLSTVLAFAYCLSRWVYEILSLEMFNEFTSVMKNLPLLWTG